MFDLRGLSGDTGGLSRTTWGLSDDTWGGALITCGAKDKVPFKDASEDTGCGVVLRDSVKDTWGVVTFGEAAMDT